MSVGEATEEIVAVLVKAIDNIKTTKSRGLASGNTWEYRQDGIAAIVRKDKNRYLLTGFADNKTQKKEATETIAAVNAHYRYTPEFADLYAQVGAVIASEYNVPVPSLNVKQNEGLNQSAQTTTESFKNWFGWYQNFRRVLQ